MHPRRGVQFVLNAAIGYFLVFAPDRRRRFFIVPFVNIFASIGFPITGRLSISLLRMPTDFIVRALLPKNFPPNSNQLAMLLIGQTGFSLGLGDGCNNLALSVALSSVLQVFPAYIPFAKR
jgi:hypothetical protein